MPRYRYDRLMDLGWKVLIPVGLVWTMVTAAFVLIDETGGLPAGTRIGLAAAAAVVLLGLLLAGSRSDDPDAVTAPTPRAVDRDEAPEVAAGATDDREEVSP